MDKTRKNATATCTLFNLQRPNLENSVYEYIPEMKRTVFGFKVKNVNGLAPCFQLENDFFVYLYFLMILTGKYLKLFYDQKVASENEAFVCCRFYCTIIGNIEIIQKHPWMNHIKRCTFLHV